MASVLYFIVLYFISKIFVLLPHIEWSAEWGKLLSTFSQTSAAGQNGISIPFARVITARFDPIPAVLRCVNELGATVLGMLMFFVNLNISARRAASAARRSKAVEHGDV